MSVSLYLADHANLQTPCSEISPVTFNDDGYYWFLYRYFESANLERHKGELIDLYGGGVIEGYQLHRLRTELEQAMQDVAHKPDSWLVLVGWQGGSVCVETEDWHKVEKLEVLHVITSLLALILSSSPARKLVCDGD